MMTVNFYKRTPLVVNFRIDTPVETGSAAAPGTLIMMEDGFDASTGLYPAAPLGSGTAGAIMRSNAFLVTTPSVADGSNDVKFPTRCILVALVDNPGQMDANWKKITA